MPAGAQEAREKPCGVASASAGSPVLVRLRVKGLVLTLGLETSSANWLWDVKHPAFGDFGLEAFVTLWKVLGGFLQLWALTFSI